VICRYASVIWIVHWICSIVQSPLGALFMGIIAGLIAAVVAPIIVGTAFLVFQGPRLTAPSTLHTTIAGSVWTATALTTGRLKARRAFLGI
jgi:hypothetical protein